jgi:hypothetical protein
MPLTKRQRAQIKEIKDLQEIFGLDYERMLEYEAAARTPRLEATKRTLVRGQVVLLYTIVDELLSMRIRRYFFAGRNFAKARRTKKFQRFNHHVLDELSLLQKLRFARSIQEPPMHITADINRLNALRNALAHTFFPEDLRHSRTDWKGKSIFSRDGAARFQDDCQRIFDSLLGFRSDIQAETRP